MPRSNKVVVGYGVRFSNETLQEAWKVYRDGKRLYDIEESARAQIVRYAKEGNIHKGESVTVFKVVVEEIS